MYALVVGFHFYLLSNCPDLTASYSVGTKLFKVKPHKDGAEVPLDKLLGYNDCDKTWLEKVELIKEW